MLFRSSVTAESGRACIAPYLERIRNGEISAVFAGSDLMALGAIELLREQGLSVPGDVSFVGFDDSPDARYSSPRLTTVRQDVLGLGAGAVSMLIDKLEGIPTEELHVVLPVELVERESAGQFVQTVNKGTEQA